MRMRLWRKRAIMIFTSLSFIATAVIIVLYVFRDNIIFFFSPTELMMRHEYNGQIVRVGGIVKDGSIRYSANRQTLYFTITDFKNSINVEYSGPVPSLFKEGSGTVALGKMQDQVFIARELLAKHDENYMPKEVADALKDSGYWRREDAEGDK